MSEDDRRVLDARMMSFALDEEAAKLKQGQQWQSGTRGSITLAKNASLTIVLVALHKGETMHEHHTEGPITVCVVEGVVRFRASGDERILRRGALLTLASAVPHEVEALEDSAFAVTVIQPQVR
jgi:quercetin dioxygenase-like cupin family protein